MIKTAPSRYRLPTVNTGPKHYVVKTTTTPPSDIRAFTGSSSTNKNTITTSTPRTNTSTPIVTILPERTSSQQQQPSSHQPSPPSQQRQPSPPRIMKDTLDPALTPSQRLDMLIPPQEPQSALPPLQQPPLQISRKKSLKNLLKRAHTTRVSSKDSSSNTSGSSSSSSSNYNKRAQAAVPEGYRLIDIRLPSGIKTQQPVNESWTVQNLISAVLLANPTHTQSRSLDSDDFMVWEVCASLKLRRALRGKELVGHVLTTWPAGDCDWYLELDDAERRLDLNSVASLCPRRDIVSAAAAGAAGSDDNALTYKCIALQRGSRLQRWRKVGVAVHNHELTLTELSSSNTSTAASPRRFLDLRELDIYEAYTAGSSSSAASANSPYFIGLRVQRSPNSFVDPKRDCVHVLSFPPEHINMAEDPAVKAYNTIRNIAFSVRSAEVDQLVKKARLASTASAHRSKSVSAAPGRIGRPRAASSAGAAPPLIDSVMASSAAGHHPAMPPAAAALAAAAASGNASLFKPNSLLNKA